MSAKKPSPTAKVTLAIDVTYCAKSKSITDVRIAPKKCVVEWNGVKVSPDGEPPAGNAARVSTVRKTINMLVSHRLWGDSDNPPDITYMNGILRGLGESDSDENEQESMNVPTHSQPPDIDESSQRERGHSDLLNWIFGMEDGTSCFLALAGTQRSERRIVDSSVLRSTDTRILLRVNNDANHAPATEDAMKAICLGLKGGRTKGAFQAQEFDKAFVLSVDPNQRREEVRNRVVKILHGQPDATTEYLAERFEVMTDLPLERKRTAVADCLLRTSLAEFLKVAERAYAAHFKKADAAAVVYREIATYVIPQIYSLELRQKIHKILDSGGNFLEIPTSNKSLIEILVAGVDGRPVMFADAWKFNAPCPPSKYELHPEPESGFLSKENQIFIQEFKEKLHAALGDDGSSWPDPLGHINVILMRRAEREPSVRYFYIYRKGQGRVMELEESYPTILFFVHSVSGHNVDESSIIDCLKCLFCPEAYQ